MFNFLTRLFQRKSLSDVLAPTKRIKLHGVYFTIRKINPLEYLAGTSALQRVYDIYSKPIDKSLPVDQAQIERVKAHYIDVFMAGVVKMNDLILTRKQVDPLEYNEKLKVDHLLTDWSLAEELYYKIIEFTYGKKKLSQFNSRRQSLLS